MLLSSPAFRAVKSAPGRFLAVAAGPVNFPAVFRSPFIDEVLLFTPREYLLKPWKLVSFVRKIRKNGFDACIVPSTVSFSLTSALLSAMSGAKIRIGADGKRFGFYADSGFFFNIEVRQADGAVKHQTDINLDFLKPLGMETADKSENMGLSGEEKAYAQGVLDSFGIRTGDTLIGVHPGAGKIPNRWQAENFARAADALIENCGAKVLAMFGPKEAEVKRKFLDSVKTRGNLHIVPQTNIRNIAAVIGRCRVFVCNDTGVLHAAAAVNTPTVAMFGPTDPKQWNPPGEKHLALVSKSGKIEDITAADCVSAVKGMLG